MRHSWTPQNVRHALSIARHGRNPAATVYDSLGSDFFLALAPGWLNLGLWDGDGTDPAEAPAAVRRLVTAIASELPAGGDVLDVGNGLGEQDPLIARVVDAAHPHRGEHHPLAARGRQASPRRGGGARG